ncbi:probable dehydrogenases with different specificities (related to short-chain alcohol dehydrogenases) [Phialocephala subalpina]|uniref:Probable dehydrogenases with different specificities (Related to short-chain alcohol dehydrogenases) n=1 Tax=Phialocephala subalpina TaxID=576137 RepID=A0A1L7XHX7_9HELO|nr:probable dehydrogenases with different specificities (related to short-chain alcohol dehydrogenases) [Phialocephala subalpina]
MASQSFSLPLQGKVAMVTGGSRGIGAGIAYELAVRGANVIIIYTSERSGPLTDEILSKITSLEHRPHAAKIRGDLNQVDIPTKVVDQALAWLESSGRPKNIDILVNNAGVEVVKALGTITAEDFAKVYDLNVRGALLMTQAVLPHLSAGGRIINISSVGSRAGFKEMGIYCSSKAALEGLTRCWAAELGKNGTTVNAVNPGPVQSEMLDNIPKDIVNAQKAATPIENRVGTVEEVAMIVCWLAGEESRWVTGQTISASGGWAMY